MTRGPFHHFPPVQRLAWHKVPVLWPPCLCGLTPALSLSIALLLCGPSVFSPRPFYCLFPRPPWLLPDLCTLPPPAAPSRPSFLMLPSGSHHPRSSSFCVFFCGAEDKPSAPGKLGKGPTEPRPSPRLLFKTLTAPDAIVFIGSLSPTPSTVPQGQGQRPALVFNSQDMPKKRALTEARRPLGWCPVSRALGGNSLGAVVPPQLAQAPAGARALPALPLPPSHAPVAPRYPPCFSVALGRLPTVPRSQPPGNQALDCGALPRVLGGLWCLGPARLSRPLPAGVPPPASTCHPVR